MQSLEAACEEGEVNSFSCVQCNPKPGTQNYKTNMVCTHSRAFKRAKASRTSLPLQTSQESSLSSSEIPIAKPPFCIRSKLRQLHEEECANDPNQFITGVKRNSNLLEKLVAKERLNTLILNLYPGNKGFSLTFPTAPTTDICADDTAEMLETKQWPYEDEELLRCIDNEELPALFIELLEPYHFLFYSGCIIAEVRDYRQAYPHLKCDIHYVLLKPTLRSIITDVNLICKQDDKVDWGTEEKQQLESQIILANNPYLCLEPSSSVGRAASRINHNRQLFNTYRLRKAARKYSQVSINRKRKLDQFTQRPGLELLDYLQKVRSKHKGGPAAKILKKMHDEIKPIPVPNLDVPNITPPSQEITINEFRKYNRPRETSDCLPLLLEEYVLETDMPPKGNDKPRVYHIKLSILQRPSNLEFLGELYLDRDHQAGERNGVACRFSLGSKAHAQRYINQFTEIFTEGGRKSVRNYKERVGNQQAPVQAQVQQPSQHNVVHQNIAPLLGIHVQNQAAGTPLMNGVLRTPPIVLQQAQQPIQNASSVPILQAQLQGNSQLKPTSTVTSQEIEINALATKLMNSAQQFQAAANAKQQQQKLASTSSNAAIINLLNSSPASNINNDASAAVVNAINNSSLLPQQVQMINQKLLGRKTITISNVNNARVLNHGNLIAVNNNRVSLSDLSQLTQLSQASQGQTITLTSVNSSNFPHTSYTTIKQPVVNQRIINASSSEPNKSSSLSALLVGTPAADRPDILGPNTNSLLLEKLAGASGTSPNPTQSPTSFIQSPKSTQQFTVQSPKTNPVLSPLSSPPPQNSNTINVQSLNFAPAQNLQGVQNVQVQLPGFAQPISLSLNVSSTGAIQGHPTSFIVSLPVTTSTCTSATQQSTASIVSAGNAIGVGTPTVVLANTGTGNIAQLVTSGVKTINQQGLRAAGPTAVTLTQGGQPFQLLTPLQRPRMQQAGVQQNIARGIQRTPITIKMATPNTTVAGVTLSNPTSNTLPSQLTLQKQAQLQQYQYYLNQQKSLSPSSAAKVRRTTSMNEPPQ